MSTRRPLTVQWPWRTSWRPCLHCAPVSLAIASRSLACAGRPLHPPPLARTTAVVGLGSHVAHAGDLEPGGLERADRRLAAGAGTLDVHVHLLQPLLEAL